MQNSKTLTVSINRNSQETYAFIYNIENLPEWATSFAQSVKKVKAQWIVKTVDGLMNIRFVDKNEFGVLDHYVTPAPDQLIFNPMRVIPNGSGSEVIFTLFQLPGMPDKKFDEDTKLVEKDLNTLKKVLEMN